LLRLLEPLLLYELRARLGERRPESGRREIVDDII